MNPTEPRYMREPSQPSIGTQTPSRPNRMTPPPQPTAPRPPTYAPNGGFNQPARPIDRPVPSYPPLAPTVKRLRPKSVLGDIGIGLICLLLLITAAGLVIEGVYVTTGTLPFGG
jgi:hypothetical protein